MSLAVTHFVISGISVTGNFITVITFIRLMRLVTTFLDGVDSSQHQVDALYCVFMDVRALEFGFTFERGTHLKGLPHYFAFFLLCRSTSFSSDTRFGKSRTEN